MAIKKNKPVNRFYTNISNYKNYGAAGSNLFEINNWLETEGLIEKLHQNLKKEQDVYTLLSPEQPKKVQSFFYPPTVKGRGQDDVSLENLMKKNGKNGVLIQGKLGQGKSMLLRYLQFLELNNGFAIPLFLELRKIKSTTPLLTAAKSKLKSLGLDCSEKVFNFLLDNGLVTLLYDGYDEVSLENRELVSQELTEICDLYPKAKVVVTSRHHTEISKNKSFIIYTINTLQRSDLAPFIKTIFGKSDLYAPIISKINESNEFEYEVLDTPLMVTWFIVVYKKRFKIPQTKLGFYEDLFGAILSRHDGFKESYDRESKSRLNDDQIKQVFQTFCYLSRKSQVSTFSQAKIKDYIQRALNIESLTNVKPFDYLYDLTHVTCLVKIDGLEYEFFHDSVPQYFSACFIASNTDENVKKFYKNQDNVAVMEDELMFLEELDQYRYLKYFLKPRIEALLTGESINSDILKLMLKNSHLCFDKKDDNNFVMLVYIKSYETKKIFEVNGNDTLQLSASFVLDRIVEDNKHNREIFSSLYEEFDNNTGRFIFVDLSKFLKVFKFTHEFYEIMKGVLVDYVVNNLNKVAAIITKEDKKEDLF
ncbi:hypothetical protein PUND_a1352 [Pseudoalteromonas undina]|uniref:NACHT family-like NTPase n=1 Tax=Pseudoalteromonas undina TaxID=43660 RepID=A0ABN0NEM0_9GAMM|nr:NACHT domain-containing protein [Pseudoalteromonas undina]KAF7765643.1 hypothetical protein PUND_a1352 [Pseudoalteromonas undina]